MKHYKLLIFDFDGTIADTKDCVAQSTQEALQFYKLLNIPKEDIVRHMGIPIKEFVKQRTHNQYSNEFYDNFVKKYREIYKRNMTTQTKIFEGLHHVLAKLKENGTILAIATSKGTQATQENLAHLGIRHYFDIILGEDLVTHKKPHPESIRIVMKHLNIHDPKDVLMIGDSVYDIQMGKASGVDTAAVTWGAHEKEKLQKENPDFVFESVEKLEMVLTNSLLA